MDDKKKLGVGIGGAVLAAGLATCPLQIALLGAIGALGFLPFLERLSPSLYLGAVGFAALSVYSLLRLRRRAARPSDRLPSGA